MAEALEIGKSAGFSLMYLCVTSNLWTRSTLLVFTAQLSVQPFHTVKEHDSVKGISEQFINLKNKLARFYFISFISVFLPFCKKTGIFHPPSVAGLIYHPSASTYPWTWSSSPLEPGSGWVWAQLGYLWLASSTSFSWHFLGRAECSTGKVLQRNLNPLPCAASTEQIQGCHVTVSFSLDKILGKQHTQCPETERGWGLTLCSILQRNAGTGTGGCTSNHICHQRPELEHLPQLPFHGHSPAKARISFSHAVLWTCWPGGLTLNPVNGDLVNEIPVVSQGLHSHTLMCQCWPRTLCSPHLNRDVSVCQEHTWKSGQSVWIHVMWMSAALMLRKW